MASAGKFEKMASKIASLNKAEAKKKIIKFKAGFKMDFTEAYLDSLSVDKLRHILFAALSTKMRTHM